jgi:IstB-like ATP binding protein
MRIAKLRLAKEIEDFVFKGTPINAELVRDLAGGSFLQHQRNVVLIGGRSDRRQGIRYRIRPARRRASDCPENIANEAAPNATRVLVLRPARGWRHCRSKPIAALIMTAVAR